MPLQKTGSVFQSITPVFVHVKTGAVFDARVLNRQKTGSNFRSLRLVFMKTGANYSSSKIVRIRPHSAVFHAFVQEKRSIYARNTVTDVEVKLGELLPGQTTLIDVALADGTYEIEVRSDLHFWDDTRSRIRYTLEVESGVIKNQGVPNIQTLSISINSSFQRVLTWTIPDVAFASDLQFGVWRSGTSPVDVSGPPDFTKQAFEGVGVYNQIIDQTADEYYAVAGFTGSEQGPEAEIFAPWDLTPEASPPQNGYW